MPVDYFSEIAIRRLPRLRQIAKGGSFATERAMFLTFERLSTRNEVGRHRELRCPRCERWPQLVKLEPNAVCLFECQCGVQIWERAPIEATSK
jgi:hypothetical protein